MCENDFESDHVLIHHDKALGVKINEEYCNLHFIEKLKQLIEFNEIE